MARETTRRADVLAGGGGGAGHRREVRGSRALPLGILLLAIAAPSCDLFNKLGDAWGTSGMPDPCAGIGGMGGVGGGAGGDVGGGAPGVGGSDLATVGAGGGSSDVGSAGPGGGAGTPRPPPAPGRHRRPRSRIGTAFQADCTPPDMDPTPPQPMMAPKVPLVVGLTTTRLRTIAAAQGIGAGHTGVQFNRDVGLAFQTWVLFMLKQEENKAKYSSALRKGANNNGLPESVVPDYVSMLDLVQLGLGNTGITPFPDSRFGEVKAVNGDLTPATKQSQILGLIDVAANSPAGLSTVPKHPPPVLEFTTTWNTKLNQTVFTKATTLGVAIWHQVVFEDATVMNDPNPELYIGQLSPQNPEVYGTATVTPVTASGAHSKLTAPQTQLTPVPGDPDPPEVE
jgi:hypothetical protein